MDIIPDPDSTVVNNPVNPTRNLKDYLVCPKSNFIPAHGWTQASVLFNHLEENINKAMDKPMSSLVAVIIGQDRPSNRAMAADAIANAIVSTGLAVQDEFTVIPATPKDGDPEAPILPHANLILCTSSQLKNKITADPTEVKDMHNISSSLTSLQAIIHMRRNDESDGLTFYLLPAFPEPSWFIGTFVGLSDRFTCTEFITALFEKLIADPEVLKLIQEHRDRVPDARGIPFVIRVLLEYADAKPCQAWMPGRRGSDGQRQNAVRLYMPPPSFEEDPIETWKAHPGKMNKWELQSRFDLRVISNRYRRETRIENAACHGMTAAIWAISTLLSHPWHIRNTSIRGCLQMCL
ncbi:hypothetical protein MVEN_00117600 [Mycena venus]|uniref:Uncharacterized protein n=1 Tax=Mycena venus TaxID=2733690 RepID=A0A8H7DGR8_9AGAR|nr:hypothetical protein MVEN_00117600 [Mycena venus]